MVHLPDPAATTAWGRTLAENLQAGDVVALCGDLGAGKTQLSKGIVSGMGCEEAVTSPTFTLVHEYVGGRLPVFHFDFYRMESATEVLGLGWDDYLLEEGVLVVEWADRFPDLLPEETRWVHLEAAPQGGRNLTEGRGKP